MSDPFSSPNGAMSASSHLKRRSAHGKVPAPVAAELPGRPANHYPADGVKASVVNDSLTAKVRVLRGRATAAARRVLGQGSGGSDLAQRAHRGGLPAGRHGVGAGHSVAAGALPCRPGCTFPRG